MRILFQCCLLVVPILAPMYVALADDSSSIPIRDSVGFTLPSANRSQSAAHADHADSADLAEAAKEIAGASTVPVPSPGEGIGVICGAGAGSCDWRERLSPGSYVVRCGSHHEDGNSYQITVIITGSGGSGRDWAGCPTPTIGRLGVSNRYLTWISRIG